MGQIDGQFILVTGPDSALRDAAVARARAEGATVEIVAAQADAVCAAAEKAGRLDAIVTVLRGSDDWGAFAEGTATATRAMLDQVASLAEALQAAYPFLKASRGRAVTVCSAYGATSFAHIAPTVAADAALQGLTRAVGLEWAQDDIQVNCLVPGLIDVPELRAFRDRHPHDVDHHIRNTPMRRLGDPAEDFGGALMMLLSDEACFLVGHAVHADGGQHLSAATFEPGAHFAAA